MDWFTAEGNKKIIKRLLKQKLKCRKCESYLIKTITNWETFIGYNIVRHTDGKKCLICDKCYEGILNNG